MSARGDIEDRMDAQEDQRLAALEEKRYVDIKVKASMGRRLDDDELSFLIRRAETLVREGQVYQHVGSGKLYRMTGVSLAHDDMMPTAHYEPLLNIFKYRFNRPLDSFLASFIGVVERQVWAEADTSKVIMDLPA